MSIITKRGDSGETDLMYGRRVPKTEPRIAVYGAIDELSATVGVARASLHEAHREIEQALAALQKELIILMGEFATLPSDLDRYQSDGFQLVDESMVKDLTERARKIERDLEIRFKGWAIPGDQLNLGSAHLDHARTIARRAERLAHSLADTEIRQTALQYVNRLSDYLWLLARWVDKTSPVA